MTHYLRRIVRLLPNRILSKVQKPPLERVYYYLVTSSAGTEEVNIKTDVGEFELIVPEGRTLPGGTSYEEEIHEPLLINKLSDILDPDSVFYDIGARYGYFVGVAQEIGVKPDNIHAFEQHQLSFNILSKRWNHYGAHLHKSTVGDESNNQSIDDYVEDHQPPDVMKIDVEGAEVSVLRSSLCVLSQHSPQLLVEVHQNKVSSNGQYLDTITSLLRNYSYGVQAANHREINTEFNWLPIDKFESVNTDLNNYMIYAKT
jgi:hypothetical protein